jgi:hypothetical protein
MAERQRLSDCRLVRFPPRRAAVVWLLLDRDGWLVIARDHGWSFGDFPSALADAQWLSQNLGMPIRLKEVSP